MKKISLLFMAVLTLGVTARAANGDRFIVDNISYTVISEENKTVIFNGATSVAEKPKGKFIIPQIVANGSTRYMVTEINSYAFNSCEDLTSVTIPSTVTTLGTGRNIFNNCQNLSEIIVAEDNATFSSFAGMLFDKNKKTLLSCPRAKESVEIPNSVTEINPSAFSGCSGLTTVTIPNSVTEIGSSAFIKCSGLTTVTIPNSVTTIGINAFSGCSGLTTVTIPNSVTSIRENAFSGCSSLTSFTFPGSVTLVGSGVLCNCSSLEEIIVAEDNSNYCSLDGVLYNKNQTTLIQVPGAKKSYEFPNSVTEIGSFAFSGCTGLTSVTIPNSVTKIGERAFYGCSGLTSVTIPNSVTKISEFAFSGCSALTSVTIPNFVTEIGWRAFSECSGLTSIYCYAINPPAVDNYVFDNVNISNAILHVVKGCETAYQEADTWKEFFIMADLDPQPESGIEGIMADGSDAPVEYYKLNGVRVDNPENGLYIKRQGGKTTKVLVK